MTLFVVGTGRCGTYSAATAFKEMGYDAHHERWAMTTVQASHWYSIGRMSQEEAEILMSGTEWGQVEVDSKLSELTPVLVDTFPDAKFLWMTRDPFEVEKSMTRLGWYRPEDDFIPSNYYAGFKRFGDSVSLYVILNAPGHRTKAYEVMDLPADKWRDALPVNRCRWFISWINELLKKTLPADRVKVLDIGTATAEDFMAVAEWAFPDQSPKPLDVVPNKRVEDPRIVFSAPSAPRKDTV